MGGACSANGEKRNANRLWVGKPEGRRPLEDQDVGGWIILRWIPERWDVMMWAGLVCLKIGTSGGFLWIRYWTFGFHKLLGNYVSKQLGISRVVLSSMELVYMPLYYRWYNMQQKIFMGVKDAWCVMLTISLPSLSRCQENMVAWTYQTPMSLYGQLLFFFFLCKKEIFIHREKISNYKWLFIPVISTIFNNIFV
jgi:hypothetical protein